MQIVVKKYTRIPFVPLLLSAITGILVGEYFWGFRTSGILAGFFLFVLIVAQFTKFKLLRNISLFAVILLLFAFYHSFRQTSEINQQNMFCVDAKTPIIARGYLLDVPLPLNYSNNADGSAVYESSEEYFEFEYSLSDLYAFRFHVNEYFDGKEAKEINETILIYGKNGYPDLPVGKNIEIPIRVFTLAEPLNPGEFDYSKYQRELGLMRYADYENNHGYKLLETSVLEKSSPVKFAINVRSAITKIALKLPPKHSALFLTLTIGNSTLLSRDSRDVFRLTGSLHLLVISGLHIGFLVLIMELLLSVFRFNQRTKAIILMLMLIFYWLVVGYKISITRAVIIGIIYYFGQLFRRRVQFTNVLAAAAFFIILYNPYELFHIGFYLSFSAVLFITFLMHEFYRIQIISDESDYFLTRLQRIKKIIKDYVSKSLRLTFAGVLGTLPIIWWKFGIITPGAFIANLLAIPLMLWILGFSMLVFTLQFFLSIINMVLAEFGYDLFLTDYVNTLSLYLTKASCLGIEILQWFENLVVRIPGCYFFVPNLSFVSVILVYAGLLLIAFRRKFKLNAKVLVIAFSLMIMFLSLEFFWMSGNDNKFVFTQLSGKHKSCSIIQTTNKKVLVHDAGTLEYQASARKLISFLNEKRINSVDALIIQANNFRYVDGYLYLLQQHKIRNVYLTKELGRTFSGEYLIEEMEKHGAVVEFVEAGSEIRGFEGITIRLISPPSGSQDELKVKYDPEFTLFTIIEGEFGNIMIAGKSSDINYDADMKMLQENAVQTKILVLPAKMNDSKIFNKWFEVINPEITITASHNKIPEQDLAKIVSSSQSFYDTQTTGAVKYTYGYDTKQETVETFK